MIVRILYVAILAILVRLVWRGLFGQLAAARGRSSGEPDASRAREIYRGLMVRDPVCGLHLPESRALVSITGGETVHFCSETCRATYAKADSR